MIEALKPLIPARPGRIELYCQRLLAAAGDRIVAGGIAVAGKMFFRRLQVIERAGRIINRRQIRANQLACDIMARQDGLAQRLGALERSMLDLSVRLKALEIAASGPENSKDIAKTVKDP